MKPGHAAGAVVAAGLLAWWTGTDRLDLPKLVVLAAGACGLMALSVLRERSASPSEALVAGLALLGIAAHPAEAMARVEGWAPWLAAVALLWVARRGTSSDLGAWLGGAAIGLAALGWAQASGLVGGSVFAGRPAVGTLGNPGHFGVALALLLPWLTTLPGWRRWAGMLLVGGAIALSGSRAAWVAGLVALVWCADRRDLGAAAAGVSLSLLAHAGWTARVGDPTGTLAGRGYLWRVYATVRPTAVGEGPEGFQRAWPDLQRAYLDAHPADAVFWSDLRHAHVDLAEVAIDYGVVGAVAVLVVVGLALTRGGKLREPAAATLVAGAVAGLAHPVLFFAPTLSVMAVAAGVRLGRSPRPVRGAATALLAALTLSLPALGARLHSEVVRSAAVLADRPERARDLALRAAAIDPRNPRAWTVVALACGSIGDVRCEARALERLVVDLPNEAATRRLTEIPATR